MERTRVMMTRESQHRDFEQALHAPSELGAVMLARRVAERSVRQK